MQLHFCVSDSVGDVTLLPCGTENGSEKKSSGRPCTSMGARGRPGNRIWQGKIGRDVRGMSCITTYLLRGPTGGETSNAKESGVYGG